MKYIYGEDIKYGYDLIKPNDFEKLQIFTCGNNALDKYIHNELISNNVVNSNDGLPFKVWDNFNNEIIAIFSLASSGIIYSVDNYTHVLPALKIDIFAVDVKYQKLHIDKASKSSNNSNEHYYLNDSILNRVIEFCRNISETKAIAKYIVLYADKNARRFYKRNLFVDFSDFMIAESNMEIMANDPMYIVLD